MKLIIKNMVCRHCMECVSRIFTEQFKLPVKSVELGHVELDKDLNKAQLLEIEKALIEEGFELVQSREAEIVDAIKRILIDYSRTDCHEKVSLADIMQVKFNLSYASLSRIFSEVEGRTIENYFVNLRIERVKELIKYKQMSLSEIADSMGYSSVAHLSRQFKQFTGLTPTQFREIGCRKPLTEV